MSPKSRGRPKGRGRPQRPSRPGHPAGAAREHTPVQQILLEAPRLAGAPILQVRIAASTWLGRVWAAAGLGDREPETELVRQLVVRTRGSRSAAAYLALQALATIAQPPWGDEAIGVLAGRDVESWPWQPGTEGRPEPVSARRYSDPWDSRIAYLVRFAEPEDHSLLVDYTTPHGVMADYVSVGTQDGDEPDIDGLTGAPVDPSEALAEIADVLWHTDLFWPRQSDPDYSACRAFARWYAAPHARAEAPEFTAISEDLRAQLIGDFLSAQGLERDATESTPGLLADVFVDFADGYLAGGVAAWSPGAVDRFLLDWVHRKTLLDPEDLAAVPEILAAWVEFVLSRKGLADEDVQAVVERVHQNAGEFRELAEDDDLAGPAKQLVQRALAAGVDPRDHDAMQAIIGSYNAEQNARRLLDSGPR